MQQNGSTDGGARGFSTPRLQIRVNLRTMVQIDEKCRVRFCSPEPAFDLVLFTEYIYQRYTIKPRKIS